MNETKRRFSDNTTQQTTEKEVVEKGKKEIIRKFTKYNGSNADDRERNNINMKQYGTLPYPVIPNECGGDEFAVKKYCKYEYEQ